MFSKPFQILSFVLFVIAGAVIFVLVRADNAKLRIRINDLRRASKQAGTMREDNQRVREIMTRAETDEVAAAQFIKTDLSRVRAEVEALETRAQATRTELRRQMAKDTESLANNRDPEKGMTRLEYFQDVGQETPSAPLQTFISAAVHGDDEKLASMVTFSGEMRGKLEAILATLPDQARKKYPTPEKLSVLYFEIMIPELPSAEFPSVSFQDSQHAAVSVRGFSEKTDQIQMQLNGQAWQVVVPTGIAERLGRLIQGGTPPTGKR